MDSLNLSEVNTEMEAMKQWQKDVEINIDQFFLLVMGIIIFLMQAGFAFLEAGSVRAKNTTNILIKNALDSMFAGVSYWLVGYAFAFGEGNAFIGYSNFVHYELSHAKYAFWFFQYVFAATAATIVSGAVAERCEFVAYIVYCIALTGFIYPVVTHWTWTSEGWLNVGQEYILDGQPDPVSIGYLDFAGSGVVHVLGGVAAFTGAAALGPRIGRFDKHTGHPVRIKGHSVPLASLGGFILVFGFFAFNGASQGTISQAGDGAIVSNAIKNTVLAGSGGAFTTLLFNKTKWFGDRKWSYMITLNGCLTGIVGVCAGCNEFETYIAFIIGILGGLVYVSMSRGVQKLKIDDPLDATAVHFGGGCLGVIGVGFFSPTYGIVYNWDRESGLHLAWQLVGLAAITAWTAVTCSIMFFSLRCVGLLRVPFDIEIKGLDIPKHGEPAYPDESYGHGWAEKGAASHRPSFAMHLETAFHDHKHGNKPLNKRQKALLQRMESTIQESQENGITNNGFTQDPIDIVESGISREAPDISITVM